MPASPTAKLRPPGWLIAACVTLVTISACTDGSTIENATDPAPKPAVTVTGVPAGMSVDVADSGAAPDPVEDLTALSNVWSIGPSGPLAAPAHITIPLNEPAGPDMKVFAAVREDDTQPWEYLPATLSADGTSASFDTPHFSLFGVIGFNVRDALETFKTDFVDVLSAGATDNTVADQPSCNNEDSARADGYHVTSSSGDAVYWCLGLEGDGRRVLKVANNRRYPLQVAHPNMQTLTNPHDYLALATLSRVGSGGFAIIAPGETATFDADLGPGGREGIRAEMDGFGQALYQLQVGVESLGSTLTRFGAAEFGNMSRKMQAFDTLLQSRSCAEALTKGPAAVVSGCFSPDQLITAFGGWAVLLVPLVVFGPFVSFLRSEWNALFDQFNGRAQYSIDITRDAAPPPPAGRAPLDTSEFVNDWSGTVDVPDDNRTGSIGIQVGQYADNPPPAGPLTGDLAFRDWACSGLWEETSHDDQRVTATLTMSDESRCGPPQTIHLRRDGTGQLLVDGDRWTAVLQALYDD